MSAVPASTPAPKNRRLSQLLVAIFVVILGAVVALPQVAYIWRYNVALAAPHATATYLESRESRSGGEAPMLPTFTYDWSFNGQPKVTCRVDLPRFRHGRADPVRQRTVTVAAGQDCGDVRVLDDHPGDRYPMVAIGAAMMLAGFVLVGLALRRRPAAT
jgi:hypothetical protein